MVCVLAALKKEIDYILDGLEGIEKTKISSAIAYEGRVRGIRVRIVRTGMGRREWEPRVLALLMKGSSLMLSTGFCGALVAGLSSGDIVVSTEVLRVRDEGLDSTKLLNDGNRGEGLSKIVRTPPPLAPMETREHPQSPRASLERTCAASGTRCRFGPTLTIDSVVRTPGEKARLHEKTGALSVEMEDFFRLQLAKRCGIPFLSVRVVLDELGDRLPGVKSGFRFPGELSSLIKKANSTARTLAGVLTAFIESRKEWDRSR